MESVAVNLKDGDMNIPIELLKKFAVVKDMLEIFIGEISGKNDDQLFAADSLRESIPLPGITKNMMQLILFWHLKPEVFRENLSWEQMIELIFAIFYLECGELIMYLLNDIIAPSLIGYDCDIRARFSIDYQTVAYDDENWDYNPLDDLNSEFILDWFPKKYIVEMFKNLSSSKLLLLMGAFRDKKKRFVVETKKCYAILEKFERNVKNYPELEDYFKKIKDEEMNEF